MAMPLAIGIIGCGRMGRHHALTCQGSGHRIAFIYDADPDRAAALGPECPNAKIVTDSGDIVWDSVDAVFVCTPPYARGPMELAAIHAGTPFFVEKPIAINSAQCIPVLRALRERPVIHSVGYMSRYRTSVRRARAALAGRTIVGVSAHWLAGKYNKPWWLEPQQSGGPFNEQCTHFVDLFRYYAGEIEQVAANGALEDVPHSVGVSCRFESGACGTLLYSCLSQHKQMLFSVLCTDGAVELHGYDLAFEQSAQSTADALSLEVETFCKAVSDRRQDVIESDFEDAFRTQLAVDAILTSLTTGRVEAARGTASLLNGDAER